jgi:EpsI family protein
MDTRNIKIAMLCLLLLLAGGISRFAGSDDIVPKKTRTLPVMVKASQPWVPIEDIPIDRNILEELKLDDYLFRSFTNGKHIVTLYIGYYGTTTTIGAAHDPLVCFPGQGWVITDQGTNRLRLPTQGGDDVNYSVMTATKGEDKEVVLYWFQSNEETASGTSRQKLNTIIQKFMGKPGQNAFVRISVSVGRDGPDEALRSAKDFISGFYPTFIDYIRT